MGRRWLIGLWAVSACGYAQDECTVVTGAEPLKPAWVGSDKDREQHPVVLTPVLEGCGEVVDVEFVPGKAEQVVVVDQGGTLWRADLSAPGSVASTWLDWDVATGWERGLLGLAFSPDFPTSGRLFLNWTAKPDGQLVSRVGAFRVKPNGTVDLVHKVIEVPQPYGNHNGGHLAFGPDGHLYVGLGDGGKANDPHGHGQNGKTFLGAMLRLDVSKAPYAVPEDNPFVGRSDVRPEIWAVGLRNPWRYTFLEDGRLLVADVGQNAWEEVGFVSAGGNAGWNHREGRHCFEPAKDCREAGLQEPLYEYPHADGQSVTGGEVAGSGPEQGRYVFGDFVSGRIWSLDVDTGDVHALGRFPIKISTFGRDAAGRVYVAGWNDGRVYRIDPAG